MYTWVVAKQYSVADARRKLPSLLSEAAAGAEVQLTRRGKPVAMLLSVAEYESLKFARGKFADRYESFRREYPEGKAALTPREARALRDRSVGRKVQL
jgi:prevent-host-death family protein